MFGTADDLQIRPFAAGRFYDTERPVAKDFTKTKNPAHLLEQADGKATGSPQRGSSHSHGTL